jgi:pantoate--beta-alanine ligase
MQRIEAVSEMRAAADALRQTGRRVALVPTMGALHAGHASLLKLARGRADAVVVSAFVNPLQFGPNEDATRYPRDDTADRTVCEEAGVDVLFTPTAAEMYPRGFSTHLTEEVISRPLEGQSRTALFRGVLTVTLKLLNIIRPELLVLGERDAQQVAVVRKALADLAAPVEIVTGPTVRDPDGMACSTRNRLLTPVQRTEGLVIWQAFCKAREMVGQGVRSTDRVVAEATHIMAQRRRVRVIYISIVDRTTFEVMREIVPGQSLLAVAVWVDEMRLTDSLPL